MPREQIKQTIDALTLTIAKTPSQEELPTGLDYSAFWNSFTRNLLHRVFENSFEGDIEKLQRWVEKGWKEPGRHNPLRANPEIFSPFPDKERKYLATVFPDTEWLTRDFGADWEKHRSFYIDVTPCTGNTGRQRKKGDRYTVVKVLAHQLELVELQMMGWIGGGVWLNTDIDVEVLAISPLTLGFRHGKLTWFHPALDMPEGLKRNLEARVGEGPLSDLWFPPPPAQTPSEGPNSHRGLIPTFVLE